MRILALETISTSGSVAALAGPDCLAAERLPQDRRSAQTLAPGIAGLLQRVGWRPADVQLVAVAVGPGSFTGLRVGVTTAKVLAYAVGAEALGVNALEAIARQAPRPIGRLWAVIDAHRQQVFAAAFDAKKVSGTFSASWSAACGRSDTGEKVPDTFCWDGATRLLDIEAWRAGLQPGEMASGPALRTLGQRLPEGVTAAPQECWAPRAATIGLLAHQRYAAGQRDDLWRLAPLYVRPSAAEEKVLGLRS